jgi:hypothetical protein
MVTIAAHAHRKPEEPEKRRRSPTTSGATFGMAASRRRNDHRSILYDDADFSNKTVGHVDGINFNYQ